MPSCLYIRVLRFSVATETKREGGAGVLRLKTDLLADTMVDAERLRWIRRRCAFLEDCI